MTIEAGDLIAVTGGTGAIGRCVVRGLLEAGFRVRLLSRSMVRQDDVEHAIFDLDSQGPLSSRALEGCTALLHFAAYIPQRQDDPASAERCFRTNALGTMRLLEAAEEGRLEHVVQTTSANAYAAGIEAPCELDAMFPSARAPFYLSSKIAQDVFGAYWESQRGLPVTTLRLSSVYGAGIDTALFTRFARSLLAGTPVRLANGGAFGADFLEVADVSRAALMFLRSGATGAFNIASGVRTNLRDAATLLANLIGRDEALIEIEPGDAIEEGFSRMDISKARECGFRPTELDVGLERLVSWLRNEAV